MRVILSTNQLSRNPGAVQNEPRRVVETFVHEDVETWEVEISDGQVITTTAEHPFWVEGKGWASANELSAGDVLVSSRGDRVIVARSSRTELSESVYNLSVDGLRNYFVGCGMVLLRVHNMCGITHPPADIPNSPVAGGNLHHGKFPKTAGPGEVLYRMNNRGQVTAYHTYDLDGNPIKRVDVDPSSRPHGNIPTPHVQGFHKNINPKTGQSFITNNGHVTAATWDEIENLGWHRSILDVHK